MATTIAPRPPVHLSSVLDDPGIVPELVRRGSPHPQTLAMAEFAQSRRALVAAARAGTGPPWLKADERGRALTGGVFRSTWAEGGRCVPGAEAFLHNERLAEAAARVFDAEVVRPYYVYVNISTPSPRNQKHTDIPAFRGIERDRYPTWLLNCMLESGLFERWRIRIATAVAWYYEGPGGGFSYWPDGWDGPEVALDPPVNSSVVGDNDVMPHRVEQIGEGEILLFPLDAVIGLRDDGTWIVRDGDRTLAELGFDDVRVSVSWKATVFADAEEARVHDEHLDDIDVHTALEVLRDDCARRGVHLPGTDLADPAVGDALRGAYLRPSLRF